MKAPLSLDTIMQNHENTKADKSAVPVVLVYQGEIIHDRDDTLSLTDMWKAAGKNPQQAPAKWRDLPATIAFVQHVEVTIGKSDSDLFITINGGRNPGTWAHWQIGLAYAKYLSPEFHMWCNTVVRERMEGRTLAESLPDKPPMPHDHRPRVTSETFKAYFAIGKLIGLDRNQSAIAANTATRKMLGIDALAAMGTTHLNAPQQAKILTPTDIGKELGGKSAMAVNSLMQEAGLQVGKRDAKDRAYWVPTEAGEPFAVWQDTGKKHSDGTPVRQLKWSSNVVGMLREHAITEPA